MFIITLTKCFQKIIRNLFFGKYYLVLDIIFGSIVFSLFVKVKTIIFFLQDLLCSKFSLLDFCFAWFSVFWYYYISGSQPTSLQDVYRSPFLPNRKCKIFISFSLTLLKVYLFISTVQYVHLGQTDKKGWSMYNILITHICIYSKYNIQICTVHMYCVYMIYM